MARKKKNTRRSEHTSASHQTYDLDRLACKFGNVNVGPEKCAVGITVEREDGPHGLASVDRLAPLVVGARLDACLVHDPADNGDVPGQTKFIDTESARIESVADCPSLNVRPTKLGFRLSFAVGAVDVKALAAIAQKTGRISLTRIGDSNGEEGGEGEGESEV